MQSNELSHRPYGDDSVDTEWLRHSNGPSGYDTALILDEWPKCCNFYLIKYWLSFQMLYNYTAYGKVTGYKLDRKRAQHFAVEN